MWHFILYKTLQAFKYLLNINWEDKFPEYVMKTDDDVYVNLPFLSSILFNDTKAKKEKEPLLQGYLFITEPMLVEVDILSMANYGRVVILSTKACIKSGLFRHNSIVTCLFANF